MHQISSSSSIRHRLSCLPLSTSTYLFAFGASDKFSLPGVPFDSVEKDPEGRFLTLTRKTKDEIIEIQVEVLKKHNTDHVPNLSLNVKILYGNNFNSGGRCHLEEFEDFYKERGVEPCNFNFLLDYISKRNAIKHD